MAKRKSKIKSSIYYPFELIEALKELQKQDISGRTINQIAIDIMLENKKIKKLIENIQKKEGENE